MLTISLSHEQSCNVFHAPQVRLIGGLLAGDAGGIGSWQQLLAALGDRPFDELDSLAMMNDSVVRLATEFD